MRRYEPKSRHGVSQNQVVLLMAIRKVRFVSSDILVDILGKDRSTMYERLSVLVNQDYVVRMYDKTYRFKQKPVRYYLSNKGIRYLRSIGVDRMELHYRNKKFTEEEIDVQFLLYKLARAVLKPYEKYFVGLTKYEEGADTFFLSPPPYFKLVGKDETIPDHFIEYIEPFTATWKIRKRINQHVDHADEYAYRYPHLLLIAGNDSTEKRIIRLTADLYADFAVFTATMERLLSGKKNVWLRPEEVDWDEELELCSLPLAFDE